MSPEPYGNLSGDSGVSHYSIGADFIAVQFQNSTVYIYDSSRPGTQHVAQMKVLADAGRGLGTYISKHVRKAFARKQNGW